MGHAVRLFLFLGVLLWLTPLQALDRSQCKQYGGGSNCWMPVIGPWKHGVCGEWGTGPNAVPFEAAFCEARGGTWGGTQVGCQGLPPPEYQRPTSEADMRPLAEATFTGSYEPLCEGPVSQGFSWGGVYGSVNCGNGNGAVFNAYGYEIGNSATPFAVTGKKLVSGVCNTTDTVLGFKGSRLRPVHCSSVKQGEDFYPTSGGTPGLCNLGIRQPTDPKQECAGCKSSVQVGNPIDPHSGVKRQVELDYAGNGPQPLRFERVYNSRVYTRDGRQWRHNYSAHIENQDFGTVPVAVAHRPSGRVFLFKLSGADYLPDTDIDDRVTRLVDGGGALTGWQYYDAETDSNELYDAEGKLLYIINRAGLAHTLQYSTGATPPAVAPGPGFLVKVIDAFGKELNFTYDLFGRLATMQDPAGQTYTYESTTLNHFASVTYPDGKKRTYLYNEPAFLAGNSYDGRLTGLVDENEVRFGSYFYDFFAMAIRSTQPDGANNTVVNNGSWPSSVGVTDARGTLRTYGYELKNGAYRNSFIRQPAVAGGTVQSNMTYNTSGNLEARVDFNGNRTNYTSYDTARNLELSRTEGLTVAGAPTAQTRTINTLWDTNFRLPSGIAEPLRITTNVYDPDGSACGARGMLCSKSIQATTDANGSQGFSAPPTGTARTWSYTYNANGSLLTANGPRTDVSDVTTYTYYANDDADLAKRGNLATITNALGHLTEITAYNLHGQPLTIVDPNGLVTGLLYDERLRLTSRSVGGELTSYEYHPTGQLKKVTLPDGSFLSYTYDAAHRLTDITDSLGNLVHYEPDAMGNRTLEEVKDPLGVIKQTRRREFNTLNRLRFEIGAQNQTTEYGYDNQGNVTSVDGPLAGTGDFTTNQYDALNRLMQMTDPGAGVTKYAYNGLDALTKVTDPRNLDTNYTVNGLGNITLQASPDTGNTTNTYDPAGNLLTQTDAKGQLSTYAYDALNRVTSITFHDGSKQTYTYDQGTNGIGRLTRIADTDFQAQLNAQIDYAYDAKGRIVSDTQVFDSWGTQHTTAYQYGSTGRLETLTYPFSSPISGGSVAYGYDGQGRVNQLSVTYYDKSLVPPATVTRTVVQNVTYHPFGGVKGFIFGNGQAYSRGIDLDGRIGSYTLGATQYTLGFDNASRVTSITEEGNPSNLNTYGYDLLDRLTSALLPSTNYGYSYDATGNRRTKLIGASTDNYAYPETSNRLSSITPSSGPVRTYTHDAVGSVTNDGNLQHVYDVRGRLIQSTNAAACLVSKFRVSAIGQRVRKTVTHCSTGALISDTLYVYDLSGRLLAETTPTGQYKRAYLYLGDQPVGMFHESYD